MKIRAVLSAAAWSLLFALAGCFVSTTVPAGVAVVCDSDAECPHDMHCQVALRLCVQDANSDRSPPELLDATVEPAVAKRGDHLDLTFTASEPLGIEPTAWLSNGGARLDMTLLTFTGSGGELRYTVTGDETEGDWLVQVGVVDTAGNVGALNAGLVRLDVGGPVVMNLVWENTAGGVGSAAAPRLRASVSAPAHVGGAVVVVDGVPRSTLAANLTPTLDPAWLDLVATMPVADLKLTGTGNLHVALTVLDDAGNVTNSTSPELAYDVSAPDTTLTGTPAATSYDVDPIVTFTGNSDTVGFVCSLDAGAAVPCSSPWTLTDLPLGSHTFSVAAVDQLGNADPSPAEAVWTTARRWNAVAVGVLHTCGLGSDDRLFCWGDNSTAELGRGSALITLADGDRGQVASTQERFRSVAPGTHHTCAIARDGTLWCWGENTYGQLGLGNAAALAKESPVRVGGFNDWLAVAAGGKHTCGLRGSPTGATLYCWGSNDSGELGLGLAVPLDAIRPTPVALAGNDWLAISIREKNTCAVRDDGGSKTVWCWGRNVQSPTLQAGPTGVAKVSAGFAHACALTTAQDMWCWGANSSGETQGTGSPHTPQAVQVGEKWRTVSAGFGLTCGIDDAGVLKCWGRNDRSQLGSGASTIAGLPPAIIDDQHDWIGVSSYQHTCAWTSSGEAVCFGDNERGQLGQGYVADITLVPQRASGSGIYASLDLYGGDSPQEARGCAITSAGALSCWGEEGDSAATALDLLQNGSISDLDVPGPNGGAAASYTWAVLSEGEHHRCMLTTDHRAFCGGKNFSGELGAQGAGAILMEVPLNVTPTYANDWLTISTGYYHTCGVRGASLPGTLMCFGNNSDGQLGQGNFSTLNYPQTVAGSWRAAATGQNHTCAIKGDGTLHCWGWGGGAWPVCYNGSVKFNTPQPIGSATDWTTIVAGYDTSCGIRDTTGTRSLACWGRSFWGTPDACAAYTYPETGWVAVALGFSHVCGIRDNAGARTVWCWGDNTFGQLGFATDLDHLDGPGQVGTDTDWLTVAAGTQNTCAVKMDGSLWCWGSYEAGMVADGLAWAETPADLAVP